MAGYNLTGAVQNFLMGMEAKRGYDANKLLGTLMGGQGSQEDERKLAQLNPQMFSGYQQMQAQQAQAAQQAQEQQVIKQLFGAAASGDQQAMQQLAQISPKAYTDLQGMIMEREKMKMDRYQQASGKEMQGYVFDSATGQFTANPEIISRIEEGLANPELSVGDIQSINKDFTALLKEPKLIHSAAKDLEAIRDLETGPAFIATVMKFMKALDPTSVVREGEFATAEGSGGVPKKLENYVNKLLTGDALTVEERDDFINTAKALANSSISSVNDEFSLMLDTYDNKLGDKFKTSIMNRIPQPFEIVQGDQKAPTDPNFAPINQVGQPQVINWSDM